jgi:hypothetical protein
MTFGWDYILAEFWLVSFVNSVEIEDLHCTVLQESYVSNII